MIYIRGDTHGHLHPFFDDRLFKETQANEANYLIVAGDFGILFGPGDEKAEAEKFSLLTKVPCTILFADGNHENFSRLNSCSVEEWNGGTVHRVSRNILHLMRGQVYEIDGLSMFVMGGAYSPDRPRRIENVSWWKEEMPSEAEYMQARKNLSAHGNKVDLIITHTAPYAALDVLYRMRKLPSPPDVHEFELNRFLEEVAQTVTYKHWFFGHLHLDAYAGRRQTALYRDVYRVTKDGKTELSFQGCAY